jgi:hypothetical protein
MVTDIKNSGTHNLLVVGSIPTEPTIPNEMTNNQDTITKRKRIEALLCKIALP